MSRKKEKAKRASPAGGKSGGANSGRERLDREDALLWRSATGDVEKLPGRAVEVPEEPARPPEEKAEPGGAGRKRTLPPPPQQPAQPPDPPLAVGSFAGIDKRTAERLKRGKLPIDATLDLHGYFQADAQRMLTDFMLEQGERGARCLLVVTGKGSRSAEGRGVLKEAVPRWLNAPGLRRHVLAISQAAPADGGTGAYYVLLRRKRG
jgi:DNA-nicking Smr family endonuclease